MTERDEFMKSKKLTRKQRRIADYIEYKTDKNIGYISDILLNTQQKDEENDRTYQERLLNIAKSTYIEDYWYQKGKEMKAAHRKNNNHKIPFKHNNNNQPIANGMIKLRLSLLNYLQKTFDFDSFVRKIYKNSK